jgi:hypothetical protein
LLLEEQKGTAKSMALFVLKTPLSSGSTGDMALMS